MADTTITWPADPALRVSGGFTSTPFLYICDSGNNRIQVTDFEFNPLFTFGSYGSGNGQFSSPYGFAIDADRIYISDTGNHRVQYFDLYGTYLGQWGSYGTANGEFAYPKGIATNGRYVAVVDQGNNRFQIFTPTGTHLMSYGEFGYGPGTDVLNAPTNCYIDEFYLCIDDTGNGYVKWYPLNQLGEYGSVILPAITVSAHGGWPSGRGNIVLPRTTLSTAGASGSVARSGSGSIILPVVTISGSGYAWHVGSGNVILPAITVRGTGIAGRMGIGAVILPVSIVAGSGYAWHLGSGNIVLPATVIVANGYNVLASPEFIGVVMNMRNKAITEYSGFAFNSMAVIGGRSYGANANGIFLLEGDSDNGVDIDAHIKTGVFDLHNPRVQRLVDAWLSLRLAGSAIFTVYENEELEGSAEDVIVEDLAAHDERVIFPKGLEGRFAAFKFENVEGSDFDLTGISIKTRVVHRTR